ncbi:uncharacterized protein B0H18DRAFT_884747, partial [Fomitopsis serialis]|uniref:uncharacterized protein n=1 Tax=Fomitopsis serialis TaxID=139415 RepID=UPI002008B343
PPAKKPRASTKKTASVPGKCGMTKKELGDAIQSGLKIEKYEAQRTMVQTTMDAEFFRAFFGVPGVKLSPSTFDETTPVVVAEFGGKAGGEIFGVSKSSTGGNRYVTNHVRRIAAILYPAEERFVMFFSI